MLCSLCPRQCKIDRVNNRGFCGEGEHIRIAKVIKNFKWEEPCISGDKGALAIFFSGCNLRCDFCQNYEISHIGKGEEYTVDGFVELLKSFDFSQYQSLDLVTPTQFSLQILLALKQFKPPVPIVWNSNGYESPEMIRSLASVVDVFLVDFKFCSKELSLKLCGAKDYFTVATNAIKLMCKLKSSIFNDGIMGQGVLIRHLILPGQVRDSLNILNYIKSNIEEPFVSIMSQFTPIGRGGLNRKLTPLEYKTVMSHAKRIGLIHGYFQTLESADEGFVPKF